MSSSNQIVPLHAELEKCRTGDWIRTRYFDQFVFNPGDYRRIIAKYKYYIHQVNIAKSKGDWDTYIWLHLP